MQDTDQPTSDALPDHQSVPPGPAGTPGNRPAAAGSPGPAAHDRAEDTTPLGIHPMRIDDVQAVIWESELTRSHHTYVNGQAERLLGYPLESWLTEQHFWASRVHPDERAEVVEALHRRLKYDGQHQHTYRMLHADGTIRWVQETVREVEVDVGPHELAARRLRGTILDVTEFRREQQAAQESGERYRTLYEDYPGIYMVLDSAGTIDMINRRGAERLGYASGELHDTPLHSLLTRSSPPLPANLTDTPVRHGLPISLERRNGGAVPALLRMMETPAEGRTGQATLVCCDLHELPRHPAMAGANAADTDTTLDPLTHALNRTHFERRVQHLLYDEFDGSGEHALALLDVDHFCLVNYRLGHAAGDEALREIADLLPDSLRPGDLLGRTGSDEFAILFENCSLPLARRLCEAAVRAIEEHVFEWAGKQFRLSASVGVVHIDTAAQGVSELISTADHARRTAARGGRSGIHVVDPRAAARDEEHEHLAWASELLDALDTQQLELYYQPIRGLRGGPHEHSRHYEMLLRMRRDERRLGPQPLLLAAERHQLATEVDRWVLLSVLQWLARRPRALVAEELCCINVSASSICSQRFIDFALACLAGRDYLTRSLCFEITETAAIPDMDDAINGMKALRAVGCRFSLDDFGSGLASFTYLRKLPVDYLKIDGSFVREAGHNDEEARMLELMHRIGREAGKQTIAEFVESPQTLARVNDIGIDFAQGYQIGRPRPISDFEEPRPQRTAVVTPFPDRYR
jgi:Amt family ammonium transporter